MTQDERPNATRHASHTFITAYATRLEDESDPSRAPLHSRLELTPRDMVTTVFETNLSLQDARLNTVMKKLTGWAAIIAVPTAVTGWFGWI